MPKHMACNTGAAVFAALLSLAAAPAARALDNPHGIAVDAAGNVYVADSGSVQQGRTGDISVFSVKVGKTGVTATQKAVITANILYPYSVAVSPFGTIYAGNLGNDTITVYSPAFTQTGTISDSSITTYATSMFVDGGGSLFALDAGGKVHVYLDTLAPVTTLNVGGIATAITPWGSNVAIWGRNGTGISALTANIGETVHGSASFNGNYPTMSLVPSAVAEDALHQQYVLNGSVGTVTVFNASFTGTVGSFSAGGAGIAIDPTHNLIYIVGSSGYVYIYSLKAPYKFLGSFL